jgi:hypothetical protein
MSARPKGSGGAAQALHRRQQAEDAVEPGAELDLLLPAERSQDWRMA